MYWLGCMVVVLVVLLVVDEVVLDVVDEVVEDVEEVVEDVGDVVDEVLTLLVLALLNAVICCSWLGGAVGSWYDEYHDPMYWVLLDVQFRLSPE